MLAGPYHSIRAGHRGLDSSLPARQSLAGLLHRDADEILAITRACFDRYLEIFTGPYPFDSYDQAFVPELAAGAEENPGAVPPIRRLPCCCGNRIALKGVAVAPSGCGAA